MDVLVEGASKWDPDVVCGRTGTQWSIFPGQWTWSDERFLSVLRVVL